MHGGWDLGAGFYGDVGDMGATARGEAEVRKLERRHKNRWHMRPAAPFHRELAQALHNLCKDLGVIAAATLAEARESEKDPIHLLVGVQLKEGSSADFNELAGALLGKLAAAFPLELPINAVELERVDAAPGPSAYRVFP